MTTPIDQFLSETNSDYLIRSLMGEKNEVPQWAARREIVKRIQNSKAHCDCYGVILDMLQIASDREQGDFRKEEFQEGPGPIQTRYVTVSARAFGVEWTRKESWVDKANDIRYVWFVTDGVPENVETELDNFIINRKHDQERIKP